MAPSSPALEKAILSDDLPTLTHLLSQTPTNDDTLSLTALDLSAHHARPTSFNHILTVPPVSPKTKHLSSEPLLLAALTGASIPIWRTILSHDPAAKNRRFGHFGTVVERCVQGGKTELLEFLLQEGARVESGRPILLRARVCGAGEEVERLLVRYGASTDFEEDERVEGEG